MDKFTLTPGAAVSISRNLADTIVTEYGVAELRGRSVRERAAALIAIAHPDFRGELREGAQKLGYCVHQSGKPAIIFYQKEEHNMAKPLADYVKLPELEEYANWFRDFADLYREDGDPAGDMEDQ